MKIYTNNRFTGFYPVGTAAVVRAESKEDAAELLNVELKACGLPADAKPEDMVLFADWSELVEWSDGVRILCVGDY